MPYTHCVFMYNSLFLYLFFYPVVPGIFLLSIAIYGIEENIYERLEAVRCKKILIRKRKMLAMENGEIIFDLVTV